MIGVGSLAALVIFPIFMLGASLLDYTRRHIM